MGMGRGMPNRRLTFFEKMQMLTQNTRLNNKKRTSQEITGNQFNQRNKLQERDWYNESTEWGGSSQFSK